MTAGPPARTVRGMDVEAELADLDEALCRAGTPERAEGERRYLKSDLVHRGVRLPVLRTMTRALLRRHPGLDRADLLALVPRLWEEPAGAVVFERRMIAVLLLEERVGLLERDDLALVERMIRTAHTWALVDPLAVRVAGGLLTGRPWAAEVLDRWAADGDFWVRRSALLAHLPGVRSGEGDLDRFLRYADAMLDEREFFVRKAIGWVLREVGRRRGDQVFAWLLPRARRAGGVTVREAVKYLSEAQRDAVLAARRRVGDAARPA